jgi:hypothetical protein
VAAQRPGQERQERGVAGEDRLQGRGVRRAEGPPGVARQQLLPLVDPLALGQEGRQLLRRELAQTVERDDARKLPDADQ